MPRLSPRLAALTALALFVPLAACAKSGPDGQPAKVTPASAIGDPGTGQTLIDRIGCGSCHVIPGIQEATGMVGPPLNNIGSRQYLAGMLHNTPDNMVTWLRFPQRVVPGNAMPDMNLSDADARNIAAYLYTLK
jgi:cytochrome c2